MNQITKKLILSRPHRIHPLVRLLSRIKISTNGCWELQTNLDHCGYGRFKIGGRQLGAHKISYILHKGDYDQDKFEIMHTCDNPCCINPAHLFAITHYENMHDCINKGRHTCQHQKRRVI